MGIGEIGGVGALGGVAFVTADGSSGVFSTVSGASVTCWAGVSVVSAEDYSLL